MQHTFPDQVCRTYSLGGPPTRNRCSEGVGEGREHAARAPRLLYIRASMHVYKPRYACAFGVWAVACRACVGARVYEGVCREGKQEVRHQESMGKQTSSSALLVDMMALEILVRCMLLRQPAMHASTEEILWKADGVNAGYSCCVRVFVFLRERHRSRALACVCDVCVCFCVCQSASRPATMHAAYKSSAISVDVAATDIW